MHAKVLQRQPKGALGVGVALVVVGGVDPDACVGQRSASCAFGILNTRFSSLCNQKKKEHRSNDDDDRSIDRSTHKGCDACDELSERLQRRLWQL